MSRQTISLSLALGLSSAACAPAPLAPAVAPSAPVALAPPRRVPIHFEQRGGKPFPYPLVHVTIAGTSTAMIVDTGATHHVLSTSMVKRLGLAVSEVKDTGTDHAGKAVSASEITAPDLVLEGWGRITETRVLAVELPAVFDALGIGGILSPQRLAALGESAVIDFPAGEIVALPSAAAVAHLGRLRPLEPAPSTCKWEDGGRKYSVPAQINGVGARLELDTGASHADLRAGSAPGRQLQRAAGAGDGASYAASGKMETQVLRLAALRFGEVAETVDVDIVPGDSNDCCDGVLGMSSLRTCVLVLGDSSAAAACGP